MKPIFPTFLSYLVSFLTPIVLIGAALRILLSPIYYNIEYRMPYFPADPYGFTQQDRLRWASPSVTYLVNNADVSYLANLQFDDGQPIYNGRELNHMADVKNVTLGALRAGYIALASLLLSALLAWRKKWMAEYLDGLRRGGWWMIYFAVGLGLIVGAGILVNPGIFDQFFIFFHHIFFEGNSWLFDYSDTLIRLFPIRFWEDAFLWAAILALGGGAALAFGLKQRV
ncbi:MAG: TIGR01906 family membrane protein [Anaerolineales bacterium]|nr:TIGR01906 family membrane protein [Anaerolineales bacterium]